MIPRLHERSHTPSDALAEALRRSVSPNEGLAEYTIVAHWPGLDRNAAAGGSPFRPNPDAST